MEVFPYSHFVSFKNSARYPQVLTNFAAVLNNICNSGLTCYIFVTLNLTLSILIDTRQIELHDLARHAVHKIFKGTAIPSMKKYAFREL